MKSQTIIKKPKYKFFGQEQSGTCGVACIRTVFYNCFKIKYKEKKLIDLLENIYKKKVPKHKRRADFKILENGTDVFHFVNLAKYHKLKLLSSNNGDLGTILTLIDKGIWPILHRPIDPKKGYEEGHFVVAYGYKKGKVKIFDPSYHQERRQAFAHPGQKKTELFETFMENWRFKGAKTYEFLAFFKEKNFKIKSKGKYF